jgi:hypothetical protein
MSPVNLQLKKFDPKKMGDDRICVFIGKRNTGKSYLIRDIMYHKKHIPTGIVQSGTEDGNGFYGNFVPDLFIYNEYDKEAVERVMDRQRKIIKSGKKSSSFMLLDDCMYDNRFLKDTVMRQVFMNGRHYNIFFMLSMQYCMDMPPALRANIDYVFVLRENIVANREKIWKNFFGIFPTFDLFNKTMDACTENFECLILDNTVKSNKIEDCVFWYKAKYPPPKFKVGSPGFWGMHKKMYNPKYDSATSSTQAMKKAGKKQVGITITKAKK